MHGALEAFMIYILRGMRHLEARNEELPAIQLLIALTQHANATRPAGTGDDVQDLTYSCEYWRYKALGHTLHLDLPPDCRRART